MNSEEARLWDKIKKFSLDDPGSKFSFTNRLSRENAWSLEFSLRVVFEYKRFMFLINIADHPLTPSDQVDQVWHLHLIYTESYWVDFCQNTMNRNIHHGPTKGGGAEREKYVNWYEKTKELYQLKFNEAPPEDIWPPDAIRFGEINFTRVNTHRNWIIKKWKF